MRLPELSELSAGLIERRELPALDRGASEVGNRSCFGYGDAGGRLCQEHRFAGQRQAIEVEQLRKQRPVSEEDEPIGKAMKGTADSATTRGLASKLPRRAMEMEESVPTFASRPEQEMSVVGQQ